MTDPTRAAAEEIEAAQTHDGLVSEEIGAILRKHFAPEALIGVGLEMGARVAERSAGEDPDDVAARIRSLSTLSTDDMIERMAEAIHAGMYKMDIGCGGGAVCKFATGCSCSVELARAALSSITGEGK